MAVTTLIVPAADEALASLEDLLDLSDVRGTGYQFVASPTSPGPVVTGPLLGLAAGAVVSEPKARTISLTGAPLPLTDATARALNETFAKPQGKTNVFQSGESLGTLSFTVVAE